MHGNQWLLGLVLLGKVKIPSAGAISGSARQEFQQDHLLDGIASAVVDAEAAVDGEVPHSEADEGDEVGSHVGVDCPALSWEDVKRN